MNGSLQWMHPLDAERTRTQVVRGESERKRAAHKQGLQRALASINQLRKEREEFAYPPASVRARRRAGGARSAVRSLDTDGKGSKRRFSKEKEEAFPDSLE